MAKTSGIVSIHGKEYATVAYRLELFRQLHPDGLIETELIKDEDGVIQMQAWIWSGTCLSQFDEGGEPIRLLLGSDYAEEVRGSSNINKTSALENASTSAVGRALALAGFNKTDTSIASADEVAIAIERQKTEAAEARATLDKMAKRSEAKATKKQRETIEQFLDQCTDGDIKLEAILGWAGVDNLSELTKDQAKATLERIKGLDIIA